MSNLNKVFLIGRLGAKPELRYTQSGQAVCNFNMATTDSWGSGDERQERTEWHRVVVWARQAENVAKYLDKGSLAFIEGRLQTRKWTDRDGQNRYTTEVVARDVRFLDRKGSGSQERFEDPPPPGDEDMHAAPASDVQDDPASDVQGDPASDVQIEEDDDIPF